MWFIACKFMENSFKYSCYFAKETLFFDKTWRNFNLPNHFLSKT